MPTALLSWITHLIALFLDLLLLILSLSFSALLHTSCAFTFNFHTFDSQSPCGLLSLSCTIYKNQTNGLSDPIKYVES